MMQLLFLTTAVIGLLYFLFAKRQFDFFSVAYFSACIYFIPGFVGYALYPLSSEVLAKPVALVNEVYLIMSIVLIAILARGFAMDMALRRQASRFVFDIVQRTNTGQIAAIVAVTTALVGLLFTLSTVNAEILMSTNKLEILEELNRGFILTEIGASLGAVLCFRQARWKLFSICIMLLSFNLYIGFRSGLAITVISIMTLSLMNKGSQRLAIQNWKALFLSCVLGLFVFAYKQVYIIIKLGDFTKLIKKLQDPNFYFLSILNSEPFTTQAILNEVIRSNFDVGLSHFQSLLYQLILFAPEFGADNIISFNDLFQPALFPGTISGMANNIWAEMISSGGWPLLLMFVALFVTVLHFGSSYVSRCHNPVLKSTLVLMMIYWAFYIHRNDILYQTMILKRIVLLTIFSLLIEKLLLPISSKQKLFW